jgi:hypothetical protein
VDKGFRLTESDLEFRETPSHGESIARRDLLDRIWSEGLDGSSSGRGSDERVTAFSLTLTAGLSGYDSAESNLNQHLDNFAAYWNRR